MSLTLLQCPAPCDPDPCLAASVRLLGWIRANFTEIYIQRNIKHKTFLLCFLPRCQSPESTLSSRKWDTDPGLLIGQCWPLIGRIISGCLCPRFRRIVVDMRILFSYSIIYGLPGEKAESLLNLISCKDLIRHYMKPVTQRPPSGDQVVTPVRKGSWPDPDPDPAWAVSWSLNTIANFLPTPHTLL